MEIVVLFSPGHFILPNLHPAMATHKSNTCKDVIFGNFRQRSRETDCFLESTAVSLLLEKQLHLRLVPQYI